MRASLFKGNTRPTERNGMSFLRIGMDNYEVLIDFLKTIGKSSETFRYFSKRTIPDCLHHHVVTLLLFDGNTPVAYGHLDREGEIVWLGICVSERHVGRGYGKMMMRELTSLYHGPIMLSTDKHNFTAISLYQQFGFSHSHSTDNTYFMRNDCDPNL